MLQTEKVLLLLVRLGIGKTMPGRAIVNELLETIDWKGVQDLANVQGLSAVVLDGIGYVRRYTEDVRCELPSQEMLLEWIGEVMQEFEQRYKLYKQAISEMAAFYNCHGYKMMVLKGYACSIDWLKPEHRPCGDIDIWQFGKQKEADSTLVTEKGVEIDSSHHHHTVFYWRDFMVENHYDFFNVHAHSSSAKMEKLFKDMGQDDSHVVEVYGEKVYLPSPNLHALFLLKHSISHFASANISLRQVLDWAFFVEKHGKEVDWKWLNGIAEEYHMKDFYYCLNAICVENLGFDSKLFQEVQFDPTIKERVLADIMNPAFGMDEPHEMIPRLLYKYKRWRGNAWKHELCYKESRWSSFWTLLRSHLMKPESME